MPIAYVGLGSNLGDRRACLAEGIMQLAADPMIYVEAVSSLYATEPVGVGAQPEFLNAVVRLEASCSADELLDTAMAAEERAGRERGEPHGPRTLDLDILLFGVERSDDERLRLPHPRMLERAFVLRPLLDVWIMGPSVVEEAELRAALGAVESQVVERIAGPEWHLG